QRGGGLVVEGGAGQDRGGDMGRVLAQADVGPDDHLRRALLDAADRARHRAVARPRAAPLAVLFHGHAEQEYGAHPERGERRGLLGRRLGREPRVPGERRDRQPVALGVVHEQWGHELVGGDARLARERAQAGRATQPAPAVRGEHGQASWMVEPSSSSATASKSERAGTMAGTPSATSCIAVVVPMAATRARRRRLSAPSAWTSARAAEGLATTTASGRAASHASTISARGRAPGQEAPPPPPRAPPRPRARASPRPPSSARGRSTRRRGHSSAPRSAATSGTAPAFGAVSGAEAPAATSAAAVFSPTAA